MLVLSVFLIPLPEFLKEAEKQFMAEATNIYPIYDKMMTRKDKEGLLGQRGVMIWFNGQSRYGKSTKAHGVEREFHKTGVQCPIQDK